MSVAPAEKNDCSTSRSGARADSSAPTSNGPEVPRPMAGSASPLDGMRRMSIWPGDDWPAMRACPPHPLRRRRRCAGDRRQTAEREEIPSIHWHRLLLESDQRGVGSHHRVAAMTHDHAPAPAPAAAPAWRRNARWRSWPREIRGRGEPCASLPAAMSAARAISQPPMVNPQSFRNGTDTAMARSGAVASVASSDVAGGAQARDARRARHRARASATGVFGLQRAATAASPR